MGGEWWGWWGWVGENVEKRSNLIAITMIALMAQVHGTYTS